MRIQGETEKSWQTKRNSVNLTWLRAQWKTSVSLPLAASIRLGILSTNESLEKWSEPAMCPSVLLSSSLNFEQIINKKDHIREIKNNCVPDIDNGDIGAIFERRKLRAGDVCDAPSHGFLLCSEFDHVNLILYLKMSNFAPFF